MHLMCVVLFNESDAIAFPVCIELMSPINFLPYQFYQKLVEYPDKASSFIMYTIITMETKVVSSTCLRSRSFMVLFNA